VTAEVERSPGLVESVIRAYAARHDVDRIDHTVQVTSFGGAGTTALCDHLLRRGVDLQKGPGQWPFKHRRTPPSASEVPEGYRVVYVVGDPRDAILSIFRRKYQFGHYAGLHDRQPSRATLRNLASLDAFLDAGRDEFELADHFARWRDHDPHYPVMFVRYDHLAEVWPEIATFVGLTSPRPALPRRERHSDWRALAPDRRRQLDALYGDLAHAIDQLPPVQVT
jgi:hypothetical protein